MTFSHCFFHLIISSSSSLPSLPLIYTSFTTYFLVHFLLNSPSALNNFPTCSLLSCPLSFLVLDNKISVSLLSSPPFSHHKLALPSLRPVQLGPNFSISLHSFPFFSFPTPQINVDSALAFFFPLTSIPPAVFCFLPVAPSSHLAPLCL